MNLKLSSAKYIKYVKNSSVSQKELTILFATIPWYKTKRCAANFANT